MFSILSTSAVCVNQPLIHDLFLVQDGTTQQKTEGTFQQLHTHD